MRRLPRSRRNPPVRRWRSATREPAIVPETTNITGCEQTERCQGLPMSNVKYISSPNEIPAGQKYVLVVYGEEYAQTGHPLGLTITVARTVSELSFLTAVHTAKEIAKHAGISEVFVCTASTRGPNPTPSGMFTYVPAHGELSSNVVGWMSTTKTCRTSARSRISP